jgi:hypothetical protein
MGAWLVIVLLIPTKLGECVSAAAEAALLCVNTFALNNIEALKAGDGRIVTKDEVLVDFAKHIEDNIMMRSLKYSLSNYLRALGKPRRREHLKTYW